MSIPDSEVQCFSQRAANGIYDRVADAMTKLSKDGLGEADFGIDWCTTVQDNYSGTNWSYVNTKDGRPFKTNIVGQITTSTCGTRHSAKGTHFTKKARSTPLTQLIFGLTLAIKECTSEQLGHRQMEVGTLKAHFMFAQLGRHLGKPTDVYRRLGD
jgi:hypothetical protein